MSGWLFSADDEIKHLACLLGTKLTVERLGCSTFGIHIMINRTVEALAPAKVLCDLAVLRIAAIVAARLHTCEQTIARIRPWRLVHL